jgi:hypothetical protein
LIETTTLGGKAGRSPASRSLLQTHEALFEEALAPLAHHLPWRVESGSDLIVVQTLGGIEDNLSANDISIR